MSNKTVADLSDLIFTYYPAVRKVYRNLVTIKNVPISMTQLTCLSIINKHENISMTELANALSMSNQQLTKVVDGLEEIGMATRTTDPHNRRKVYAGMTEKGKETMADLHAEIERKLGYILRKKSDDEVDKLYECIAHVARYFGFEE